MRQEYQGESNAEHLLYNTEMSRILGFYSHTRGPTVISPWHTGHLNPEIVEVHEGIHRDLTNTTSTGVIGKVLGNILSERVELPEIIAANLRGVLGILLQETILPHEAAATYLSFKVFFSNDQSKAKRALSLLPPLYSAGLSLVEEVVGDVGDPNLSLYVTQPVVLALAKVALSPPSHLDIADFPTCASLSSYYKHHSANTRFRTLISLLRPPASVDLIAGVRRDLDSVLGSEWLEKLRADDDFSIALRVVPRVNLGTLERVTRIAAHHGMQCCVDMDKLIEDLKSLIGLFHERLSLIGVSELANIEVRDNRNREALENLGVDYSVPAMDREALRKTAVEVAEIAPSFGVTRPIRDPGELAALMPKDTSFGLPFVPLSVGQAREKLKEADRWFFNLSPFALNGRSILSVSVGAYSLTGVNWNSRRVNLRTGTVAVKAFSTTVDLFTLLDLIEEIGAGRVVLKMDDRFGWAHPELSALLRSGEAPFFLVVHDTTVGHVDELLRTELSRCKRIAILLVGLGAQNVIVIANSDDHQGILSPIAKTGYELLLKRRLQKDPRIEVLSKLEELRLGDMQVEEALLRETLFTTYLLENPNG